MAEQERSYWELLEPYWGALGSYGSAAEFLASAQTFPRPIVLLYAAHFCQSEVHNGGLLQFFYNSTGVLAPEAIEGYYAIGMPMLAHVVEEAVSVLGPEYPREREERWDALLKASPLTAEEMERIFSTATSLYAGYYKATLPLNFHSLERQFYHLVKVEARGFRNAATVYALAAESALVWHTSSSNVRVQ